MGLPQLSVLRSSQVRLKKSSLTSTATDFFYSENSRQVENDRKGYNLWYKSYNCNSLSLSSSLASIAFWATANCTLLTLGTLLSPLCSLGAWLIAPCSPEYPLLLPPTPLLTFASLSMHLRTPWANVAHTVCYNTQTTQAMLVPPWDLLELFQKKNNHKKKQGVGSFQCKSTKKAAMKSHLLFSTTSTTEHGHKDLSVERCLTPLVKGRYPTEKDLISSTEVMKASWSLKYTNMQRSY